MSRCRLKLKDVKGCVLGLQLSLWQRIKTLLPAHLDIKYVNIPDIICVQTSWSECYASIEFAFCRLPPHVL